MLKRENFKNKKKQFNLEMYKPFLPEEIERIKQLNEQGYNGSNISRLIGVPYHSVRRYCKAASFPEHSAFSEKNKTMSWENRKKRLLKTLRRDTGDVMNYRHHANQLRAMRIGFPDYELSHALVLYALENGPSQTPEILTRINAKRKRENWKPSEMSYRRFIACIIDLKRDGLVRRVSMAGLGLAWRKMPRIYSLTEKAIKEIYARRAKCLEHPTSANCLFQ